MAWPYGKSTSCPFPCTGSVPWRLAVSVSGGLVSLVGVDEGVGSRF
jgi:hypothetical protein